ncbi:polysaccharide pyruvyl transferase family protein [Thomasclavelia sp.]|uniref:polysaccharide pyruvyl transferase family protein n=1 Tax=Thomasclavelia sp. TaxID=3025757 RepID=UPI0025D48A97|nr:polysaccharide pyruvyl transferase family protein [Thomasclavelia sp.]
MKVGIVTWFYYDNYGTRLQAMALQNFLLNDGYNVELINFEPPEIYTKKRKNISLPYLLKKANVFIKKNRYKKDIRQRNKKLNCFLDKLNKTRLITNEDEYIAICNKFDVIIFGSDQIWNPKVYHEFYYGDYNDIYSIKLAYAPSLGVSELNEKETERLKKSLKDFYSIYIREQTGAKIISKIMSKEIIQVVDPTLLLNSEEWNKLLKIKHNSKENYILCYFLGDNKNHWKAVKRFSNDKNLKLKIIGYSDSSFIENKDLIVNVGVDEFVSLIANAKYVITDSFHGLIFSIIYKKRFVVFERFFNNDKESQNSRLLDLLNIIDCNNKLIIYNSNTIQYNDKYDYKNIYEKLYKKINESKFYLDRDLKNIKLRRSIK